MQVLLERSDRSSQTDLLLFLLFDAVSPASPRNVRGYEAVATRAIDENLRVVKNLRVTAWLFRFI